MLEEILHGRDLLKVVSQHGPTAPDSEVAVWARSTHGLRRGFVRTVSCVFGRKKTGDGLAMEWIRPLTWAWDLNPPYPGTPFAPARLPCSETGVSAAIDACHHVSPAGRSDWVPTRSSTWYRWVDLIGIRLKLAMGTCFAEDSADRSRESGAGGGVWTRHRVWGVEDNPDASVHVLIIRTAKTKCQ